MTVRRSRQQSFRLITLDHNADSYHGMANVTVTSPSGAILRQSTATSQGTRLQP